MRLSVCTEAEQQLRVHGRNELEEKSTSKLLIFLKLVSTSPYMTEAMQMPRAFLKLLVHAHLEHELTNCMCYQS